MRRPFKVSKVKKALKILLPHYHFSAGNNLEVFATECQACARNSDNFFSFRCRAYDRGDFPVVLTHTARGCKLVWKVMYWSNIHKKLLEFERGHRATCWCNIVGIQRIHGTVHVPDCRLGRVTIFFFSISEYRWCLWWITMVISSPAVCYSPTISS